LKPIVGALGETAVVSVRLTPGEATVLKLDKV
jgi:hypothetical protein